MSDLEAAINIGPVLAGQLRSVGIADLDTLAELGSFDACRRLEASGMHDCTHARLALEGAIRGVRWMSMPPAERAALAREWRERDAPAR